MSVSSFRKVKLEISLPIRPKYLNDPSTSIFKHLSKHLLQYSHTLNGFPLCFEIEGVLPHGTILEDGSVYVACLIKFYVFRIEVGEIHDCAEGVVCGIFGATVGGEEEYSGEMIVTAIKDDLIQGKRVCEDSSSDF